MPIPLRSRGLITQSSMLSQRRELKLKGIEARAAQRRCGADFRKSGGVLARFVIDSDDRGGDLARRKLVGLGQHDAERDRGLVKKVHDVAVEVEHAAPC